MDNKSNYISFRNKDIYFEKDNTAFSEEIEIKRGHKLIDEFPKKMIFS